MKDSEKPSVYTFFFEERVEAISDRTVGIKSASHVLCAS